MYTEQRLAGVEDMLHLAVTVQQEPMLIQPYRVWRWTYAIKHVSTRSKGNADSAPQGLACNTHTCVAFWHLPRGANGLQPDRRQVAIQALHLLPLHTPTREPQD